ncbi:MAG: sigma 54-dependent Fis family transcriptional regulator [Myxococcales bacterium]|nr:sigma 54-dependent Fis family transcriptional regulator [Myxococcales bacterium]
MRAPRHYDGAVSQSLLPSDAPALTTVFAGGRATVRHLRKSKIVITSGGDAGRELEITKPRVSGGRSIINDLVLSDKAVSSTHFEVISRDDGFRLRDLDSTNGTFIGDLRVKEVFLKPGSVFRVGHTDLRFSPTSEIVEIALSERDRFDRAIGGSVKMREVFAILEKVAPSDLTVLITGETGTGKEMIARGIHNGSSRRAKPFVVIDCSAIPRDLIESTLFGHEKGSFTGAIGQHRGLFEQAQGGTIFLDEIGELDLTLQPKLLRVLEQRELKRVGGDKTIKFDARVLAATNRDLRQMVNAGTFREDLYFRLSVIYVELPPLREREGDIPSLVQTFLREIGAKIGKSLSVSPEAMQALSGHPWPGNVRELRNVVERAAAMGESQNLEKRDLSFGRDREPPAPARATAPTGAAPTLTPGLDFKEAKQRIVDAFEVAYLRELLTRNEGNITRSAQSAGLTRYHLRELLKRHAISARDAD